MTRTTKLFASLGAIACCCVVILLLLGGSGLIQAVEAYTQSNPELDEGIHFYNDDVQSTDHIYNFGPSAYDEVKGGKYKTLYGELLDRMKYDGKKDKKGCDPNLMAAIAYAIDLERGTNILKESHDSKLKLGERPNKAAERLLKSAKDREDVYKQLEKAFSEADVTTSDIGTYTSQMYQLPTGTYFQDRPAITVKNTQHEGGHVLVFKWKDGKMAKFRLECGYQPTDVPEWTPPEPSEPSKPSEPSEPSESSKPSEPSEPSESSKPSEPSEPSESSKPPEPEPKRTEEAAPVTSDPDIGGKVRPDDIDTTPTSEPDISSLPEKYKAPDPPKEESSKPAETSKPTSKPESKPKETTEVETSSKPESTPEVSHEGKTYEVAPPQVSNPPLESVNEEAPVASGVDEEEVQSGTVDPNLLDQFY